MEVDNEETTMKCFKIPSKIVGNLKISYDIFTNYTLVLWSKYQLFVYFHLNFDNLVCDFEPNFEIVNVIVINGNFLCLDCTGNVNVISLSSQHSINYSIWKHNINCICACEIKNIWCVASLQDEQNRVTLWINEFKESNSQPVHELVELKLQMPQEDWVRPGDATIIVCGHIEPKNSEILETYNIAEPYSSYLLVIISFDNRNVYAVFFPIQDEYSRIPINAQNCGERIYRSHTDIIDIKIAMMDNIHILVGLSGGNIVKIPLLKNHKPEIYHLNTSINKFVMMKNTVLYTDTLTMWKYQNAFSKSDSTFTQFKIRNIRDFCIFDKKIICITFSNLIYYFDVNDQSSYLSHQTDNYCGVQLVSNSDYTKKIINTLDKNEELIRKINKESENLMALSLSKRQDVMDELLHVTACVFNDYRNLTSKYCNLTLTDSMNAYCDSESCYFLINVIVNRIHHKLNKLLSDVLDDIKIHITLSKHGILKTTSIQIKEQLRTKKFVIPLKRKNRNITRMNIHVQIITNVPGKYDENQQQWTILYQKHIDLTAENFINVKSNDNTTLLKGDEDTVEMLTYKISAHQYPEYKFQITDCPELGKWHLFVKLPQSALRLKDILDLIKPEVSEKAYDSFKHLVKASEGNNLEFQVDNENVKLNIADGNLVVDYSDIMVGSDIRNFFSRIIFNAYKDETSEIFIDQKYYTTIENLKRDINDCISKRKSAEEFTLLLYRFLTVIYCSIPI